jgi:hypothetical protein
MDEPIRELDVVALTEDIPSEGLLRGQVGTIVHVYSPTDFEVEFADNNGQTSTLATLSAPHIFRLRSEPMTS